jgi:hypothetical protein
MTPDMVFGGSRESPDCCLDFNDVVAQLLNCRRFYYSSHENNPNNYFVIAGEPSFRRWHE